MNFYADGSASLYHQFSGSLIALDYPSGLFLEKLKSPCHNDIGDFFIMTDSLDSCSLIGDWRVQELEGFLCYLKEELGILEFVANR